MNLSQILTIEYLLHPKSSQKIAFHVFKHFPSKYCLYNVIVHFFVFLVVFFSEARHQIFIHFQNRRAVNKDPVGFELRPPVDFPNPFDEDEDDDEIDDDLPLKPPRLFKSSPILWSCEAILLHFIWSDLFKGIFVCVWFCISVVAVFFIFVVWSFHFACSILNVFTEKDFKLYRNQKQYKTIHHWQYKKCFPRKQQ